MKKKRLPTIICSPDDDGRSIVNCQHISGYIQDDGERKTSGRCTMRYVEWVKTAALTLVLFPSTRWIGLLQMACELGTSVGLEDCCHQRRKTSHPPGWN